MVGERGRGGTLSTRTVGNSGERSRRPTSIGRARRSASERCDSVASSEGAADDDEAVDAAGHLQHQFVRLAEQVSAEDEQAHAGGDALALDALDDLREIVAAEAGEDDAEGGVTAVDEGAAEVARPVGERLDGFQDALPRLRGDLADAAGNAGDGRDRHPAWSATSRMWVPFCSWRSPRWL